MKLYNLQHTKRHNKTRISADMSWEDSDRAAINLFFETDEAFGESLCPEMNAFLVGCILPAMYHGEKRINVEGSVCPELCQNLNVAMTWVRHWFADPSHPLVKIEASVWDPADKPRTPERSGFFLSGGLDSLATLQSNHMNFPPNHPAAIRDGLLIYGQNIESDVRPEIFQQARNDLSNMAKEKNVTVIPVYTNIREVDNDRNLFSINHGAVLGAVAHAFSNRLTRVYVSASDSIPTLSLVNKRHIKPNGSHPLLDPLFSSYRMSIRHDGITQSRLDKSRLIGQWDSALQQIRVCSPNWPGENCCKCEKCVRTMLALLAAGLLHKTKAFSVHDVTPQMIAGIKIKKPHFGYSTEDDYLELVEPLERIGRYDLVKAILGMIDRSFYQNNNFKQKIRKLDAKYLDGCISRVRKRIKTRRALRTE